MKEPARSGYPGQLTFDYLDPRMDRRLRGLLAEVAAASRLRRIAGVFILFGGFMFVLSPMKSEFITASPLRP